MKSILLAVVVSCASIFAQADLLPIQKSAAAINAVISRVASQYQDVTIKKLQQNDKMGFEAIDVDVVAKDGSCKRYTCGLGQPEFASYYAPVCKIHAVSDCNWRIGSLKPISRLSAKYLAGFFSQFPHRRTARSRLFWPMPGFQV